ncbi:semaphorin-4D-like [Lacerta agilis]|uniref:semaphorin-4D-like n=1 Tax=Lacerta agilis TaxID=80427 RepID=UPI001419CAF0|nr:semaphorin-4D-like [Lacerta agilis]
MILCRRMGQAPTRTVYVFFTEAAVEFEFYDKLLVSRIAQICTGDLGRRRTLKKKWTSFLKATLVCSAPESDFQFNVLHAVFMIKTTNWQESIFYGIFTQHVGEIGHLRHLCVQDGSRSRRLPERKLQRPPCR